MVLGRLVKTKILSQPRKSGSFFSHVYIVNDPNLDWQGTMFIRPNSNTVYAVSVPPAVPPLKPKQIFWKHVPTMRQTPRCLGPFLDLFRLDLNKPAKTCLDLL